MRHEIAAYLYLDRANGLVEEYSSGILIPHRVRYPLDFDTNDRVSNSDYESYIGHIRDSITCAGSEPDPFHSSNGRLGQVVVSAGKRRMFAIPNWFVQRLLSPVHHWAAAVLSRLRMDGSPDCTIEVPEG